MNMRIRVLFCLLLFGAGGSGYGQGPAYDLPLTVGVYEQQVHRPYTTKQGLPGNEVLQILRNPDGGIVAVTDRGAAVFDGQRWTPHPGDHAPTPDVPALDAPQRAALHAFAGATPEVRGVAAHAGEVAVAADTGLYLGDGQTWHRALPRQGVVGWAPADVRAVAYDYSGNLWFAAPQGVGRRTPAGEWNLFTGAEGLPFNDFTCIAPGPKGIWFGTTNGAILFRDGAWSFRQGGRWLLDNHVRSIAVDDAGNAWIATSAGVSCIAYQPMTLAEKAAFFEEDLEKYHRRTPFGYVNPAELAVPGDRSTAVPVATDNDGQRIGMYLGAVSLAYAATGSARHRQEAVKAFRALAFLSEVTQGGTHPGPKGLISRCIMPVAGPDPNEEYGPEYDQRRRERDALWKLIQPRWPIDASGEWYWMNDGSADELDGHYFGYGIYYDRVCETEAEKEAVREVVRRVTDHLIDHGYNIVDFDGTPTRWGRLSPGALNRDQTGVIERGLRSFAMLAYLSVAHHITGDQKYREAYLELALDQGYAMNGMTQPRDIMGPGNFGQGDDKMAFLNYYHLIRYESDQNLLNMYYHAIHRHWQIEQYEQCPWANFVYAACCLGKVRYSQWGEVDVSPPKFCFEDGVDTLKRYPLDLLDWPMSNAHRIDMIPLRDHLGQRPGTAGHRVDGRVFPIDERYEFRWGRDPYLLSNRGAGTQLGKGVHYMLAYYLGRVHGFIAE